MNQIIKLSSDLVKKIAAGEVIERPASVIKELVENSIDAGATEVSVEIQNGGLDLIKIVDNGKGMSLEDAKLAYELHTTSKVKTLDDLNKILTFGFRGEALASIGAVAEMTIHTAEVNQIGVELIVENSELTSEKTASRSNGTTIIVRDLFRHLPARKKFLNSQSTEYRHVLNEVYKVALGMPAIGITLKHNDKEIFKLAKGASLGERIVALSLI